MNRESAVNKEGLIQNDRESINFRRNSNTLVIFGTGVMIYGVWTAAKIITYIGLGNNIFDFVDISELNLVEYKILFIVLMLYLMCDMAVRIVIGMAAIFEGKNPDRRFPKAGIFFTVWEIAYGILSTFLTAKYTIDVWCFDTFEDNMTSLFMELTSLVMLIEVFIATISVRRYKKNHIERSK